MNSHKIKTFVRQGKSHVQLNIRKLGKREILPQQTFNNSTIKSHSACLSHYISIILHINSVTSPKYINDRSENFMQRKDDTTFS